jgi:hypothetical protein
MAGWEVNLFALPESEETRKGAADLHLQCFQF